MPRPKSVKSLEDLCIEMIGNNLDKFHGDESSYFECLPSRILHSIMNAAQINGRLNDHLALLITSHLDTLDLTESENDYGSEGDDDSTVLQLLRTAALERSPLKYLKLPASRGVIPILPAFPNLIELKTSCCDINDDILALLATCCLNLRELSVCGSKDVTDVGIRHLIGFQNGRDGAVRGCKFLIRLNIKETGVTSRGARLAMEHLPKLEIFDYRWSLQVAVEMFRTNGHQLNLKNLNAKANHSRDNSHANFVRGTLIDALRLCPFVIDVNLSHLPSLLDKDLASLVNLKCLKKLTLKHCQGMSFDGGLLPILKKFGPSSLESLTLVQVPDVNIGSIVEFCSELQEIRLDGIHSYSPSRPGLIPGQKFLTHLHRLTVRECNFHPINHQLSYEELSLLLGSASTLTNLRLFDVHNFTDQIVEEAIAQHGFPHLETFVFDCHCPIITKKVVDLLLELDNPLSSIAIRLPSRAISEGPPPMPFRFLRCGYSMLRNRRYDTFFCDLWKKKILENNWELEFHYLD